jgi:nucleotide-binding universal stress UspA family protein
MFAHILAPIDGTAQSNAALPLVRSVARQTGASITLMHVLQPTGRSAARLEHADATAALERIAAELTGSGLTVDRIVCHRSDVAGEILQQSQTQGIDLIVMRTHGRAGLERAVLGSVAQRVLAESDIPVMLMRAGERRINHIRTLLVPVDGSPGGAAALGTAVALAQATGASIKLLEVAPPMASWVCPGDAYGGMTYYDPAWDEDALSAARVDVDGVAARLREAGLAAESEVRQEPGVANTIVAAAEAASADLVVMSTHALTGPARAVLGSVADAVVRASHCPVLLVHRSPVTPEPAPRVAAPASA